MVLAAAVALAPACAEVEPEVREIARATATDEPPDVEIDVVTHASEVGDIWVNVASPVDGDTMDPGFTVYIATGPGHLIQEVEVSIDGAPIGARTTGPYNFPTDGALPGGAHTISVTATDGTVVADDAITIQVAGASVPGDPDPDPEPDPTPDPEPDPAPTPTPTPDPEPIGGDLPAGCAAVGGTAAGAGATLLALACLVLARRRRR